MGESTVAAMLEDTFYGGTLPRFQQLRRSKSFNNNFSDINEKPAEKTPSLDGSPQVFTHPDRVPCDDGNSIQRPRKSRDATFKSPVHNLKLRYSKKDGDRYWGGWEGALLGRKKKEKEQRSQFLLELEDIDFLEDVVQKEDFERMYDRDVLVKEYAKLKSSLRFRRRPWHRSEQQSPLLALAEGGILRDLTILREHDIFDILRKQGHVAIENCPLLFVAKKYWDDITESHTDFAMDVIENYSAMKDYYKTHLMLELTHEQCYSVFDTLIIRTLKEISLDALFGYAGYWKECLPFDKELASLDGYAGYWEEDLPFDKELAFKRFVDGVINGLHQLAALKSSELRYYQDALVYPISVGVSGDEDAAEMVKIADLERRKEGCRFICRRHVEFAHSLTNSYDVSKYRAFQQRLGDKCEEFPEESLLLKFCCSLKGYWQVRAADYLDDCFLLLFPKPRSKRGRRRPTDLVETEEVDVFSKFGLDFSSNVVEFLHSREEFVSLLEDYFYIAPPLYLDGT